MYQRFWKRAAVRTLLMVIALPLFFVSTPRVQAGDVFARLTGGQQDVLALVQVVSLQEKSAIVQIFFLFPSKAGSSLERGDALEVDLSRPAVNLSAEEMKTIALDKKYVMSLNVVGEKYVPAWGIYEVDNLEYTAAELIGPASADNAAMEYFIQSGGRAKDFYFSGDKAFVRTSDGGDKQLYPPLNQAPDVYVPPTPQSEVSNESPWYRTYGVAFAGATLVIGAAFFLGKRKRNS